MRRGGGGEAVCLRPDRNVGEARDDFAVGLLFQPRLDRLPIGKATCARERGGKDGFADAGVGAGDDETGHAAAIAAASVSAIASIFSASTLSVIAMRRRALPCGNVGGRMPRLSNTGVCTAGGVAPL